MHVTRIVVVAALLTAPGCGHSEVVRPVDPEVIKKLETPANVFVDGTTLFYEGIILEQPVVEVERLLRAAARGKIQGLVIKSDGGEGSAGIRFGELVRDWKLSVTVDRYCMSACANYVAIAANVLSVPEGAVLGYHGGAKKNWADDGKFLKEYENFLRSQGFTDKFLAEQLEREKGIYARQEALFRSVGVSMAILDDTAPDKIAPAAFWMFKREVLVRCYSMKSIKQYPALASGDIPLGKSTVKVMTQCPSKAP